MARGATWRALPWTRLLAVAQAAVATKRHWDKLTPEERRSLARLVRKSRGRPSNLSLRERNQLRRLVAKLELRRLGRDIAALASPLPRRGRRR
jgi:hypothetical protein